MKKFLNWFGELGVHPEFGVDENKRTRMANMVSVAMFITVYTMSSIFFYLMWSWTIGIVLGFVMLSCFFPPTLNYFKKPVLSKFVFAVVVIVDVLMITLLLGAELNLQYYFFAIFAYPILLFGNSKKPLRNGITVVSVLTFLYLQVHFEFFDQVLYAPEDSVVFLKMANNIFIIFILLIQTLFFLKENTLHLQNEKAMAEIMLEKNKELEHFTYVASHDLKEPLKIIEGYIDVLKDEVPDKEKQEIQLSFNSIDASLERMETLISALQRYTKMGSNNDVEDIVVHDLIKEIETELEDKIKLNNAQISFEKLPIIKGNKKGIQQVFRSLISNAIKFQKSGNHAVVTVSCESHENQWIFCVKDNGLGIHQEHQEDIFKMYKRLHSRKQYTGYGIGLAFCKKIVEAHKGKIWIDSEAGKGSSFYFSIPKS